MAAGLGFALSRASSQELETRNPYARHPGHIEVEIEYPPEGTVVNGSACGVFVAGRALVVQGATDRFDVVVVLDTSLSTVETSGVDINGNGVVGVPEIERKGPIFIERSSDPGDSVLAAEVAATRLLLRGLDPRRTRVAVVTFAGEPFKPGRAGGEWGRSDAAVTVEPLSFDHARIDSALAGLLNGEPFGKTDMAAGLDQAIGELMNPPEIDAGNPGSQKLIFFLTDGQPTLPYGPASKRQNIMAVFEAVGRAARADIQIHSFALGPNALEGPIAVVKMAEGTGGTFTPVRRPGDLVQLMDDVRFSNLQGVLLRNLTTEADAHPFRMAADGSWIGFIKMHQGLNRIEVIARAELGMKETSTLDVHLDPNAPPHSPLPMYVIQQNELFEQCLRDLRRLTVEIEQKRTEAVRRELRLEVERAQAARKKMQLEVEQERAKARKRAREQRKELDLTVEE